MQISLLALALILSSMALLNATPTGKLKRSKKFGRKNLALSDNDCSFVDCDDVASCAEACVDGAQEPCVCTGVVGGYGSGGFKGKGKGKDKGKGKGKKFLKGKYSK
jgi:hypothetical protein